MIKNKIIILAFVLLLMVSGVAASLLYYCQFARGKTNKNEFSATFNLKQTDWSVEAPFIPFQIRYANQSGGVLLLNDTPDHIQEGHKIFKYSITTQSLAKSSLAEWNSIQGSTSICLDSEKNSAKQTLEYKVIFEDKEIPTIARYPFSLKSSLSGEKYAVISVEGPITYKKTTIIPGLPGERIEVKGKRYLELFSMPEGKRIKQPVEINFAEENPSVDMCWSADDKFLVVGKDNLTVQIFEIDKMPAVNNSN